jgi:hypothetical protein
MREILVPKYALFWVFSDEANRLQVNLLVTRADIELLFVLLAQR